MTIHTNISITGPYTAAAASSDYGVSTEKQGASFVRIDITHSTDVDKSLSAEDNKLTDDALIAQFQDLSDDLSHDIDDLDDDDDVFFDAVDDGDFYDLGETPDGGTRGSVSKSDAGSQQGVDELDSGISSDESDMGGFEDMPHLEPSPIKHEKPYSLKEKQQDYNELIAVRGEVKEALGKTTVDGVTFAILGKSAATGATSIFDGIKAFEMAKPDLIAKDSSEQTRTDYLAAKIKTLKTEIEAIRKKIAQYKGEDQGADFAESLNQEGKPSAPTTSYMETFESVGNTITGILSGTKQTFTQLASAGLGAYLSDKFGGIIGFSGQAAAAAYGIDAILKLPKNISDAKAASFLENRMKELTPKLIKLFHLEAEQNVQLRNVERVRISIHERKIQKNSLILEAKRLDFELGARALSDSSVNGGANAYETKVLEFLKSSNPEDFEDLQGLIEKQERVVALCSKLANPVSEPVAGILKQHPVAIGNGQVSKSIRTNAAQSAPAFTLLFAAIWHKIVNIAVAVANSVDFWSDILAANKARKEEKANYASESGKALVNVLLNDPERVDSSKLARENLELVRSDEQSKSLLIGMRLSDNLALQTNSGTGSLTIKDSSTDKMHLVTPTVTMARHLINYLTDLADQQVQPGAFEAMPQDDGSFIVNDSDRKIYSFLSYVPTAYTSTMGAAHVGGQLSPNIAALTIDDPSGSFPGNTSSVQFNMELDAQGKEILRVRLSHDKHKPVFAALNNESATGTRTIQDISNVERLINRPTDFSKLSTPELESRKSQIYADIQSTDRLIEGDFKQINVLKNQQNPYFRPLDAAAQKRLLDQLKG